MKHGCRCSAVSTGTAKEASPGPDVSPRGRLPVRGLEIPGPGAYENRYLGSPLSPWDMFLQVGRHRQTSLHRQACGASSTFLGSSAQQAVPLVYGKRCPLLGASPGIAAAAVRTVVRRGRRKWKEKLRRFWPGTPKVTAARTVDAKLRQLEDARASADESKLREALEAARRDTDPERSERAEGADALVESLEQTEVALNCILVDRALKNLKEVMGSGDEAQLRDAIQAARDVELPLSQLEKAEKALTEMVQERELKVLRSATVGDDETQLRNAIKEARLAGLADLPTDDVDKAQDALNELILARERKALSDAMETGDEIQLRGAVSDASKADVPVEEVEEAQKFLQRLTLRRRVDFLEKAIGSRDEGQLREAIAAARKVSLPEKNGSEVARANSILGQAQATLKDIFLEKELKQLQDAVTSGDEDQLREALTQARALDLPEEECSRAQEQLNSLVLARKLKRLRNAAGSDDEGQLRAAITEARKDGLPAEELERANDALSALVRQRDVTELREAAASGDEELLREAILEAKQLELPSEEVDTAQAALTVLVQRRSERELEQAMAADESELKAAIAEARKAGLSEEVIEKAKETLRQKARARISKYLQDATDLQEEEQLRDALTEARKADVAAEDLEVAQAALTKLVSDRLVADLRIATQGNETELREAIREARRQELPSVEIDKAQDALAEMVATKKLAWLRRKLETMVDCEDEDEVREVLKEARAAQIGGEELEKARDRLTDLVMIRELMESYTRLSLRTVIEEAELRQLEHPALDVARSKLSAINRLKEAEQSRIPQVIEAALAHGKSLRIDPDVISSAEGVLERELGIQRFGLKHDKVIQERGGQALPIPVQERFRSTDLFLTLLQVVSSRTLQQVAMPVAVCTIWAACCAAISSWRHSLPESAWRLNQFLVTPLGLLLTFRTQQSIARFNEAVTNWGKISSLCRSLSRTLFYHDERVPRDIHRRLAQDICLFPEVLREHLENRRTKLLNITRDDVNKPLALLDRVHSRISGLLLLELSERSQLLRLVEQLSDLVSPCESVVQTPVPQSYVRHTGRFLAVWLLTLPLALAPETGWLTVLIELITSWGLLGIQEIGLRLEDPFNGQVTMQVSITTVAKEVRQRYVLVIEELLRAHASDQLEDVCQRWSHRFDSRFFRILRDEQRLAVEESRRTSLAAVLDSVKEWRENSRPTTQKQWPFGCSTATGRFEAPESTPGPGDYESKPGSMPNQMHASERLLKDLGQISFDRRNAMAADLDPWSALDDEKDSVGEEELDDDTGEVEVTVQEEDIGFSKATSGDAAPWAALDEEEESVGEEEWKLESHDDDVEVLVEDDEFLEDELPELQEEFEELRDLKEIGEPNGEPQGESEEEEVVPGREDDLKLSDVPEDMREAVQGSLSLKRVLEKKYGSLPSEEPDAKRRREEPPLEGPRQELIDRWKLHWDPALRYVMQTAEIADVEAVAKTSWKPMANPPRVNGRDPKSFAEQVNEKFLLAREDKLCSKEAVSVLEAWNRRWGLQAEDVSRLRSASHKSLRYVMQEYDGKRPILELLDEAAAQVVEESEKTEDALPDNPGLFTLSRFNRLELIDSMADALVLGDANLTFSALLAEHREGLGHVGRVVATTFETIEILRERYSEIDQTVKALEDKMSEVLHNVDATRLAVDPRFQGMEKKFGAVYYNFPHAGAIQGFFDGHPFVRWRHENLMHLFFRALRGFVQKGGVVKVASNCNATGVRYSDIVLGAQNSEFIHVETFPFLEWQLRNYRRSYGDRRDKGRRPDDGEIYRAQRAQRDMVYCFRYECLDSSGFGLEGCAAHGCQRRQASEDEWKGSRTASSGDRRSFQSVCGRSSRRLKFRKQGHVQQLATGRPQSGNGMEMPGFGSSTARKIVSSPRSLSPNASVSSTKNAQHGGTPSEVGPGTYDSRKPSLARAAGAKFAASQRFAPPERTTSPGPGEYDPPAKSRPKAHRFPNTNPRPSIMAAASKTRTPGPACYDTLTSTRGNIKRTPGYSMCGRPQETRETSPGPTDYGGAYTLQARPAVVSSDDVWRPVLSEGGGCRDVTFRACREFMGPHMLTAGLAGLGLTVLELAVAESLAGEGQAGVRALDRVHVALFTCSWAADANTDSLPRRWHGITPMSRIRHHSDHPSVSRTLAPACS
ncbi:unnamed protein product [Symbiodinium sp. KB8]|nr:unnamed protein product [Symbiodinium sp. KB8]